MATRIDDRIDEEFTAEDLLEELQQFHSPISERREGGITAGEYAKAQGCSRKTARRRLNEFVDEGLLIKERCKMLQGRVYVYYRA
ncbi:MAG: hypothetical protein ACYSQZ_09150 [Planctomycetota bacterium]